VIGRITFTDRSRKEIQSVALFEDDSLISWNFANWVTIGLIALIWFFLIGLLQKYIAGKSSGPVNASVPA